MASTLIKLATILTLVINLYNPVTKAQGKNFKQSFYIVEEGQHSQDIYEDLTCLIHMDIPVIVAIDPNLNINKNVVDILGRLQKDERLNIILKDSINLEKTYFLVKGYNKDLKISGLYNIEKDKLNYMGKDNLLFNLIKIGRDPLETKGKINSKNKYKENHALVVEGKSLNVSTLLLAYDELDGEPIKAGNHTYSIKGPALIYKIFSYIGDATIVFFTLSIIIFMVAIGIFKIWSNEAFFDQGEQDV